MGSKDKGVFFLKPHPFVFQKAQEQGVDIGKWHGMQPIHIEIYV
jgi:hypothetical protein